VTRRRGALLVALGVLCGACGGVASTGPAGTGVVVRAVDGDTVEVRVAGRVERVRLIGVDTPETVDPRRPVGCYGPEASTRTKELLAAGTTVRLERDDELRDRYGRLLAYVHRGDGLFVNETLLAEGDGRLLIIPPNDAYRSRFVAAQRAAQAAGRGLWSACPHE